MWGRYGPGLLASILDARTRLSVQEAAHGLRLEAGRVYVAPPDRHLRVSPRKTLCLSQEERVEFTRPAADPLFKSVAAVFGARALGVVLTGRGKDGAAGVRAIKAAGGTIISQDPEDCYQSPMPKAALRTGCVHVALGLRFIAPALVTLAMVPGAPSFSASRRSRLLLRLIEAVPCQLLGGLSWLSGSPASLERGEEGGGAPHG